MKIHAPALAALPPPSLVALAALQCLATPVRAILAPIDRARRPAPLKLARGEAWAWVDGDEGRFREGGWQSGPGRGYFDEPAGQPYRRGRYERAYQDFEGDYDEPPYHSAEYDEGFGRGPSGNRNDQWSEQYYGGEDQQYRPDYGQRQPYRNEDGPEENYYPPERRGSQQQYPGGYPASGGGYMAQQTFAEGSAFDRRPPFDAGNGPMEQSQRWQYDEAQRPFDQDQPRRLRPRSRRNGNLQKREPAPPARRGEIARGGEPFGFGMMPGLFSPFAGFPMASPFAGFPLMDPFMGFGMVDQMMDRMDRMMSSEMQTSFGQASLEGLLDDARGYLLDDPAAADMLGDEIQLGMPFARSSSAALVNGMRKSRIQLGVPVSGSRGTGRVKLLADEDRITRIELDVEGRTMDIPVSGRRRSNSRKIDDENVIDANVLDKETYY